MLPVVVSLDELAMSMDAVVLLDARTGAKAGEAYAKSHLRGARFVDLETELAAVGDPRQGGRHPLPTPARFAAVLGRLGARPADRVVVYDMTGGVNAAARLWWMLRAAGHADVRVVDAKPDAFAAAGLEWTDEASVYEAVSPYPFEAWQLPTVTIDEVDRVRRDESWVLIDVRAAARYRGEVEPIDPVAGHIPGAKNLFHMELAGDNGRLLPAVEIAAKYAATVGEVPVERVVVHCGSGVTACHAALALAHAGVGIPAVYVGSWSEWCRHVERPRAEGELGRLISL